MTMSTLVDLSKEDRELAEAAQAMISRAYAPYSRFGVGAAVRSSSGAIHSGCNVENASYGLTMCAEVGALCRAAAEGDFRIEAIAVAGGPLDGGRSARVVTPCGRCRQLIFEAAQVSGQDVPVLCCSAELDRIDVHRISFLLPEAFGPKDLGVEP